MNDRFSLIKEHERHFQIHDSDDNTHFTVAKKDIHPATQMKILKLKKFSEGGDVEEDTKSPPSSDDVQTQTAAEPVLPPPVDTAAPVAPTQAMTSQPQWQAPMLPPDQAPAATQSAEGPTVTPAPAAAQPYAMPGMQEMAQGLKTQAGAEQQAATMQQDAIRHQQQQQAVHELQYQDSLKKIETEQAVFQKQLQDGKIEPRRYFDNMNTGQRVGTAIAMILGGIGAGLSHGPNMAMQMIDKSVDQDIEAQKASLGKTQSLLGLNMQKYHNLQTAEAATRLHYNTVLGMQLQAAQSKATNGIAQGALQLKLGELKHQDALYRQQIALQGVKSAQLGGSTGDGGIAVGQEPPLLLLDPKYRESRVVVDGKAFQANDKEAAGKVRDVETLAGPVLNAVREIQQLGNDASTRIAGSPSNLKAHALMGDLAVKLPLLSGAQIGAKRINGEEIKHQMERIQDPTRMDQALGQVKNDLFFRSLEDEVESVRRNHIVGYQGMGAVKSFQPAGGKLPLNK